MKQAIVVCAFIHNEGKLFLPRRAATKKFMPNRFELVGGHVELGEDILDTLKRELQEEFNKEISIGDPFYAFTYLDKSTDEHTVEVIYFAKFIGSFDKIVLHPEDHSEYLWVTEEEYEKMAIKDDAEYVVILKGFELLKNKNINLG